MTRIFIKSFGCKSNFAEIFNSFLDLDVSNLDVIQLKKTDELVEACINDIIIVNTCVVTKTAEKECITFIKRISDRYPTLNLYLTGCLVNSDKLKEKLSSVVSDKCNIVDTIKIVDLIKGKLKDSSKSSVSKISPGFMSHTRGFLKIQDGCKCFCNYCIVPYVRPWCSVPFNVVIQRFKQMLDTGYKEIVLTGINIGMYGKAPGAELNITFLELLEQLLNLAANKARVRVSSIEPEDVNDKFINLFYEYSNLCSHLHLPLQSGSDKVLKEMNRKCSREKYAEIVKNFRLGFEDRVVSADILIGYPTESEDDFQQTLSLISELNLERVHIFTYSPRPGTPAAALTPIPKDILLNRKDRIFAFTKKLTEDNWLRFINSKIEVLTEEQHSEYSVGLGKSYQQVKIMQSVPIGELIEVELTSYKDQWFNGKKCG